MTSESTKIREAIWSAPLNEYQEVRLCSYLVRDEDESGTSPLREELTLELRPLPTLEFDCVIRSAELEPGARHGQAWFGEIEVRCDESRMRVWFVDVEAGRVIASLDRNTGVTTGPDDPAPEWASVDGGILLE
jgi:hypothetical protein